MTNAIWRHFTNDETQSNDTATYQLDLPDRGALHALLIRAKIRNGASNGRNVTPLDALTEIKITSDQQFPLYALSSQEAEKWQEVIYGQALPGLITEAADGVQEMLFTLMFGDKLFDPNFFIPLDRIEDAKLEIEHAFTAAASDGFATGTLSFDVMGLITPELSSLSYAGTWVKRRIKKVTSVAGGEEVFEMPARSLIRNIGVYAYEGGIEDGVDITAYRLEEHNTARLINKGDWQNLLDITRVIWGAEIEHTVDFLVENNDTWNSRLSAPVGKTLHVDLPHDPTADSFAIAQWDVVTGDLLTFNTNLVVVLAGSESMLPATTAIKLTGSVKGSNVSYFGILPLEYPQGVGGLLDVNALGGVDLVLTNGGAGASVRVSVEELRQF